MNRAQLKAAIKPIVEECVRETILESGILSTVITEVMKGLKSSIITESAPREVQAPQPTPNPEENRQAQKQRLAETKSRMLEAIGRDAYKNVDLFEGTDPIGKAGIPDQNTRPSSPLSHIDPRDPGVDIGRLTAASKVWKKLM